MNQSDPIAMIYNDKAVLEAFQCSFTLTLAKKNNLCCHLDDSQRAEFRKMIIALIIATDTSALFGDLGKFRVRLQDESFLKEEDENKLKEDVMSLVCIMMRGADIGHSAKPWEMHYNWYVSNFVFSHNVKNKISSKFRRF